MVLLAGIIGFTAEPGHGPLPAGELRRIALDISSAPNAIGWKPWTHLEDGLAETVAFLRDAAEELLSIGDTFEVDHVAGRRLGRDLDHGVAERDQRQAEREDHPEPSAPGNRSGGDFGHRCIIATATRGPPDLPHRTAKSG